MDATSPVSNDDTDDDPLTNTESTLGPPFINTGDTTTLIEKISE